MCMFEEMLKAQVDSQWKDDSFPFTLGINAFRGYLDEFHKRKISHDLPDVPKVKKEKKKKDKDLFVSICSGPRHSQGRYADLTHFEVQIWLFFLKFFIKPYISS